MTSKPYVLRIFSAHIRLFLSLTVGVLAAFFLPFPHLERTIFGGNIGTVVYLALVAKMMFSSSPKKIELRANEDEGQFLVLILAFLAVVFSLVTITSELSAAKDMAGDEKTFHVLIAGFTIFTSWLFIHTVFALHYAHDFYDKDSGDRAEGLDFPKTKIPDYADFLYFSFIIGTSAQTADVGISSQSMRRLALVHCILAFLFNTTLLALTINIASSLF